MRLLGHAWATRWQVNHLARQCRPNARRSAPRHGLCNVQPTCSDCPASLLPAPAPRSRHPAPHLIRRVKQLLLCEALATHEVPEHQPLGPLAAQRSKYHLVAHAPKRLQAAAGSRGRGGEEQAGVGGRFSTACVMMLCATSCQHEDAVQLHCWTRLGNLQCQAGSPTHPVHCSLLLFPVVGCFLPAHLRRGIHSLPHTHDVHQSSDAAHSSPDASPPGGEKAQHLGGREGREGEGGGEGLKGPAGLV